MAERKIINVHTHVHKDQNLKERVKLWEECGCIKVCVNVLALEENERTYTNEEFIPMMKEYSDMIIGMGKVGLGWDPDEPDAVDWLKENGYYGLKFIAPSYHYDNEIYYPLYERAQELDMPILFHTGYLGNRAGREHLGISTDKMKAMRLDTIGRAFPDLRIMIAHLGNPLFEEGLSVINNFDNIYGEYSGASGSKFRETQLRRLFQPLPGIDMSDPMENLALTYYEKLCFATDNPEPPVWIDLNERVMDELEIPPELREKFYWKNAAAWLGMRI